MPYQRNIKTPKEKGNRSFNVEIEESLYIRAKAEAAKRDISLRQLVVNGLHLTLNDDDMIIIDEKGQVSNDLRGVFNARK